MTITRRGLLGAAAAIGLGACSSTAAVTRRSAGPRQISQDAYDALVLGGPVADPALVSASPWATKIKVAGVLRRGGTTTVAAWSFKDPTSGRIAGFDAGIGDLLAHYITGGKNISRLTQVTQPVGETRETLLQNGAVDVVVATYSITAALAQKVALAGPYYTSGASILVRTDDTSIARVEDLKGKKLVTVTGSTGVRAIQKYVPGNQPTLYEDTDTCAAAVAQGRADAYIDDESTLLGRAVKNPNLVVVGSPFTTDPYGIGLSRSDPSAKTFVNTFLQRIYDSGDWLKLWKATLGVYIDGTPTPPSLGSAAGS